MVLHSHGLNHDYELVMTHQAEIRRVIAAERVAQQARPPRRGRRRAHAIALLSAVRGRPAALGDIYDHA
jgi:hypothetical protein